MGYVSSLSSLCPSKSKCKSIWQRISERGYTIVCMFDPQLPPINVVVQQAPGMPEWIKTLISAGTGAFFGIATTLATDLIKKIRLKREIERQIAQELIENLTIAEEGLKCCEDAKNIGPDSYQGAANEAMQLARKINPDRFNYYFENHKSIVYEIDNKKRASGFYATMRNALPLPNKVRDLPHVRMAYVVAVASGRHYLREHNLPFVPHVPGAEDLYRIPTDDIDLPN